MVHKKAFFILSILIFFLATTKTSAQDQRAQLPGFLSRTSLTLNIGYINYPFDQSQLESGFKATSVHIPHVAVRLAALCYRIRPNAEIHLTYMRPVNWVQYKDINGDNLAYSVFLNWLAVTFKYGVHAGNKVLLYGEAGPALFTRLATLKADSVILKGATYLSAMAGAGAEYQLNNKWSLRAGFTFSPSGSKSRQPHAIFISAGATFKLHPLPDKIVQRNANSGYIFPFRQLQVSVTSNFAGYGVNRFFAEGAVPIFWSGDIRIAKGLALQYQQNVYHGHKLFSFDLGSSISTWQSKDQKVNFFTLSVFPVFRFTLLHTKPVDFYFDYSAAGLTYISSVVIDNKNSGKHFTFQDYMGIGFFSGKKRQVTTGVKIQHYSNGNIFTANPGLQIPLTFYAGYNF
jgi:opacity protein-like surface antigen